MWKFSFQYFLTLFSLFFKFIFVFLSRRINWQILRTVGARRDRTGQQNHLSLLYWFGSIKADLISERKLNFKRAIRTTESLLSYLVVVLVWPGDRLFKGKGEGSSGFRGSAIFYILQLQVCWVLLWRHSFVSFLHFIDISHLRRESSEELQFKIWSQ